MEKFFSGINSKVKGINNKVKTASLIAGIGISNMLMAADAPSFSKIAGGTSTANAQLAINNVTAQTAGIFDVVLKFILVIMALGGVILIVMSLWEFANAKKQGQDSPEEQTAALIKKIVVGAVMIGFSSIIGIFLT